MNFDAIIAGAGIWGCTLARRLADAGKKVLVIEKRNSIGGNARSQIDKTTGIEVHLYGSHIFHTHNEEVWKFINRYVDFNGYQHKVLAKHKDKLYFLPIGLQLINKFFGIELTPKEVKTFMLEEKNSKKIFDAFFRGYTSKQWGYSPENIDINIIKRVPIRNNYDTNYFNDYWQGIPTSGYNSLFEKLLDSPLITLKCNEEFSLNSKYVIESNSLGIPIYYSGPIDKLFEYKYGPLPWRSLRFESMTLDVQDFQGTSVVNYVDIEIPFTRIHEFKHYHPEKIDTMSIDKTIIMKEYPQTWSLDKEPYYPINTPKSKEILDKYIEEVKKYPFLTVGGRLGSYKYLDMDQTMEDAMKINI